MKKLLGILVLGLLVGCADGYTKYQEKHGASWKYAWVKSPSTGKGYYAASSTYSKAENSAKLGCRERGIYDCIIYKRGNTLVYNPPPKIKTNISVWEHYVKCGNKYNDFRQIAQCGKTSRINYINQKGRANAPVGGTGDMYVQFMDAIAESINDGKLSNSEAKIEWIKVTQQIKNQNQQSQSQTVIIPRQGYGGIYPLYCRQMGGAKAC